MLIPKNYPLVIELSLQASHTVVSSSMLMFLLLASGCSMGMSSQRSARLAGPAPHPVREFRGVWIATVANIDWPSQPGLSSHLQQEELRAMFDRVEALNMNAVVLQVRPAADAMYASDYEPWSWYLTGEMGLPPSPYYDPLAFAVEEAHRRGLELHAWFNPFRAGHASFDGKFSHNHIRNQRPDLVVQYGEQFWLDPGMPDAREHSMRVIMDVVKRYDIDGIHLDDYFYPYPIQDDLNREVPFPDSLSWRLAESRGIRQYPEEWRRSNINNFVEKLYREVKAAKSWVKVGLSPFGIWRPGYPSGIKGFDAYDKLYADARTWLQKGWVDYFSPQLYWPIDSDGQSYPKLLDWWKQQNVMGRYVWPGNAIYRIESHKWSVSEIVDQIELTRAGRSNSGNVLFSMRTLNKNAKGIGEKMKREVYNKPALIPPMPWLSQDPLIEPVISLEEGNLGQRLVMSAAYPDKPSRWIIRVRVRARWYMFIESGHLRRFPLDHHFGSREADEIVVSFINRVGQESGAATIRKQIEQRAHIGF